MSLNSSGRYTSTSISDLDLRRSAYRHSGGIRADATMAMGNVEKDARLSHSRCMDRHAQCAQNCMKCRRSRRNKAKFVSALRRFNAASGGEKENRRSEPPRRRNVAVGRSLRVFHTAWKTHAGDEFTTRHGKLSDSLCACGNGKPLAGAMTKKTKILSCKTGLPFYQSVLTYRFDLLYPI